MALSKKIQPQIDESQQLRLLYGDDSPFRYWESHLFNEVYLRRDLSEKHSDRWNNTEGSDFQFFMNTLRNLASEYKGREKELSNWSETETINNWVKHVLEALGWKNNCTGVQNPFLEETSFRYDGKTYRTDILIVDHPKEKQYVNQSKGDDKIVEARNSVIMPIEVKYWQRLEEYRQGRKEETKRRNSEVDELEKLVTPNEQTTQYMAVLKKNWGILTDGARWRLFSADLSLEDANRYYEFNLYSLIESINTEETEADRAETIESAKYFFHFFSKFSFYPKEEGTEAFVDEVLRYSKKYVSRVEEDLKERFVKAMNIACNGFYKVSRQEKNQVDINTIRNVAESTLFNVLFIKSLESRGVLPMGATDYRKISLSNMIDKIERFDPDKEDMLNVRELDRAFRKGNGNSFNYSPKGTELHDRILRLTSALHNGSSKKDDFGFEIAGFKESIFTTDEWSFFKGSKLQNSEWVKILFQLGYADADSLNRKYQQIPYSYFTPRQLGSIYESFLEFQLQEADSDMIFEQKQWKNANIDSSKYRTLDIPKVRKGELFFTPDNEDKKASGSYYTPDFVVQYMMNDILGPLVHKKLPEEILKLRICDPAMGSGHFLIGALNYISKAYLSALINNSTDDIHFTATEAKRKVLEKCIFGVDLNERAVKLSKMSLWLETASFNQTLENLNDQLMIGDSLVDSLKGYDRNFIWEKEIFKPKNFVGFDAVIGNPPYVRSRHIEERMKAYFSTDYQSASYQPDTFLFFLEKALRILKQGGQCGFIIPNGFLTNSYYAKSRRFYLQNSELTKILDLKGGIFKGAAVDTNIIIYRKCVPSKDHLVRIGERPKGSYDLENCKISEVSQKSLMDLPDSCFNTGSDASSMTLLAKMNSTKESFGDHITVKAGMKVRKCFVHDSSEGKNRKRFLLGRDVSPLNIKSRKIYVEYSKNLEAKFSNQAFRDPEIFEASEKILIRKVTNPLRFFAAFDDQKFYCDQSLYVALPKIDSEIDVQVLSAILVSKAVSFYYGKTFSDRKTTFPQVKGNQIEKLPLPKSSRLSGDITKALKKEVANLSKKSKIVDGDFKTIDSLVYKAFELTKDEIASIEEYFLEIVEKEKKAS